MKRIFLIVLVLINYQVFSESVSDERIIRDLLGEMFHVIENSENDLLKKTLIIPKEKFIINDLHIIIKEDFSDSILGKAQFGYNSLDDSDEEQVIIEKKLLRFYPDNKSLIMAIIMHEFKHASDFYSNTAAFKRIESDELEKFLYEMDAIYIESEFINECKNIGYELTKFEEMVLTSANTDNLQNVAIILNGVDKDLVYYWYSQRNKVFNNTLGITDLLINIVEQGETIIEDLDEYKDQDYWYTYYIFIRMMTYDTYLSHLLNNLITEDIFNENTKLIEQINSNKNIMQGLLEKERENCIKYNSQLMENYIKNDT